MQYFEEVNLPSRRPSWLAHVSYEIPDAQPVVDASGQDLPPGQRAEEGRVDDLAVLQRRELRHVIAAALACQRVQQKSSQHDNIGPHTVC